MSDKDERLRNYAPSVDGRFSVVDTIGVPHPYCITPKHVAEAADNFFGRLGTDAIKAAERHGASCGICRGSLRFEEHKTALLVSVAADDLKTVESDLRAYLLPLVEQAKEDNFEGFAFIKQSDYKKGE